ncbi:MAG: sulfotransferase family protein [Deltaproteobacteria bacterium]|nr:sulfotransferase family protein [Deltaproteobacteria bacterium]
MIRLDAPDRVTIVSGLPRSGTSLLMQLLEAAGLSLARDGERGADPDNPRGYHELAAVKRIRSDASFVEACRGRVVKIVAPLLSELRDVDPRRDLRRVDHRVLLVERALDEVLASQRAMLARRGEPVPRDAEAALARAFEGAMARARAWLEARPSIDVLFVDHEALVARPASAVEGIVAFLARTGADRIPDAAIPAALTELAVVRSAMEQVVDPALHRQRVGSPPPRA